MASNTEILYTPAFTKTQLLLAMQAPLSAAQIKASAKPPLELPLNVWQLINLIPVFAFPLPPAIPLTPIVLFVIAPTMPAVAVP